MDKFKINWTERNRNEEIICVSGLTSRLIIGVEIIFPNLQKIILVLEKALRLSIQMEQ